MWQAIQNITGYKSRRNPSCVGRGCQMSLTAFMLTLVSSSNISWHCAPPAVSIHEEREENLHRVNLSEAAGPDNCVQRPRADQLDDVITDIFNIPPSQESVSTCFKTAAIFHVPEKLPGILMNWVRNCFSSTSNTFFILYIQFVFRTKRSTEDTILPWKYQQLISIVGAFQIYQCSIQHNW